jgi:hypothetical protein
MIMTGIDVTEPVPAPSPARRRAGRALTIVIALLVGLADWLVCTVILRMDLMVDQGTGPSAVQPGLVSAAPILSGLTGWALLAILERISARRGDRALGTRIWTIIAIVVCLLSCFSPIVMALSVPTAIALVSMHLLVGATLIVGLRRR